ncbi:MAG: DNA-directed RNA polymerase subunit D [Candidatus Marsarchaeota archaeon]|nr:DNA-directed RNA polymerase subunit D [Candidatus Marsarchaeota archaeon]
MKFTVLEDTPLTYRFKISDTSYNFANALRRVAISSVGCLAIDKVTFYENTSSIFDEYIAHRIGLVPILTPSNYDEKDEVIFSLSAEGPVTVYSKDLKSADKSAKVANENIPIMKLAEGQSLRLEGKAILGVGSKSSKFQPGIISYKSMDNESEFEFFVESYGQMPAHEIIKRALNIISSSVKEVHKELK